MSLAILFSRGLDGVEAPLVTVEVHLANGLPAFNLVGLAEAEVRESRDRVRAALQTAQFEFPARRITVSLAPADLPKESGRFDLPIALGILAASGQIPGNALKDHEFAGELALTGELRPIRGALAMAYKAQSAGRAFVLPSSSAQEAALVPEARVLGAQSLLDVCAHLTGKAPLPVAATALASAAVGLADLAEVKGQQQAKRALEVAAAGGHSLLFIGPPGTGKSMLAARLAGILPPMSSAEALETAAIHSLTGRFSVSDWARRPFRAPHHTASAVALVGGGGDPRPGEISLAHHGVLFLDELPEWDRRVLEVLREPLESGRIHISRAARQVEYPAAFQFLAAMNPCPCGHLGDTQGRCRCTSDQVARYRAKISGPLMDRIDLQVEVPTVPAETLRTPAAGDASAAVRDRVTRARTLQLGRQGKANCALGPREVERWCLPEAAGEALLAKAMVQLRLSARAYHRILKVARSISDLAGEERPRAHHVAEAIGYRRADCN